nr:transposase [Rubripirellula obstinata]
MCSFQCDSCGSDHWVGRSCGNRHCPNCQKNKTSDWLAKQTDRLLPVHHFLVTFTVPEELRSLLRSNQREGYAAIFACGSETIRDVGSATRSLKGCELGFFGVLHTWGRDPTVYHPHVHFVVPGGGVNKKLDRWQQTAENFLFDHGTACRVYKAKFADHLRELGLYDQVDASVWKKKWIVDIRAVGDGRSVLKYLAPYVHRVAISDNRIVSVDEKTVTFRYTPSKSRQSKTRSVSGHQFVGGFAQHVLPSRLQKIRYYGWMSPNSGISPEEVRWLLAIALGWAFTLMLASPVPPRRKKSLCKECGGELRAVLVTDSLGHALYSRPPPYRDTG